MILFASGNKGKCAEAKQLAAECGVELVAPSDLTESFCKAHNITFPTAPPPDVEETGKNYEENALLKAQAYHEWSGLPAVADDTGLEVEALGGEPGLYAARYAGEHCSPEDNMHKLLAALDGQSNRQATFICVLCMVGAEAPLFIRDQIDGEIAHEKEQGGGFGYDPLFFVPEFGHTLAHLKGEGVEVPTHRRKALQQLFSLLG